MPTFLHVGCGSKHKDRTTRGFNTPEWRELRLDMDANVQPDIVGSMLDMSAVGTGSVDAVFSSHSIEHLYLSEVPLALAEFKRVIKFDGFVLITCPDLQGAARMIAEDRLFDTAYMSPGGAVTPFDILYSHRAYAGRDKPHMDHHCGFTKKTLTNALLDAGFATVGVARGAEGFDLWALATPKPADDDHIKLLAAAHFP